MGCWQARLQLHSGESEVPQGAFFYLFVSCNTAPATDLWYPCRARGRQVHTIKDRLKINTEPYIPGKKEKTVGKGNLMTVGEIFYMHFEISAIFCLFSAWFDN